MDKTVHTIDLQGERYLLMPLPSKVVDELGKRYVRHRKQAGAARAQLELAVDIVHRSLCQSHSTITRSFVADRLDLSALSTVIEAINTWKASAGRSAPRPGIQDADKPSKEE